MTKTSIDSAFDKWEESVKQTDLAMDRVMDGFKHLQKLILSHASEPNDNGTLKRDLDSQKPQNYALQQGRDSWVVERDRLFPNWHILDSQFDLGWRNYKNWLESHPKPRTDCVCGFPLEPNSRYCAKGC